MTSRRTDVVVVGGGQAGLTAGYYLLRADIPFVILDAESRVGDVWRRRWDSLELFTTARYSELPGLRFPGDPERFPGKDEIADYLEQYARTLELPILAESRATALERLNGRYRVVTASGTHEAEHVIVATGAYQRPAVPPVAETLSPDVTQLHSADYRNPEQVGAAGRTVRFVGGRTLEVAGVVWATGFAPTTPGSTCRSSMSAARPDTPAASPNRPGCTSSGCTTSTPAAPR